MRDETQQKINAIRREAEADLGYPLPSEVWARMEKRRRLGYTPGEYDGDPDGAEYFIAEYRDAAESHVGFLKDSVPQVARQLGVMANPIDDKPGRARKISRRPFERRLYLFDFIIQAKGGFNDRANWPAIAEAWNRQHPNDPQSPRNLKSRFWEMKHDSELIYSWVALSYEHMLADGLKSWSAHIKAGTKPPEARTAERVSKAKRDSEAYKALAAIDGLVNKINRDGMDLVTMLQDPDLDIDELQARIQAKGKDSEVRNARKHKTKDQEQLADPNLHWQRR